jgi:benzylsuccinate CoA-transferase BbsF subunit
VDAFVGATLANGYPGDEPAVVGVSPWTDSGQAITSAFGILTALYHRLQTGEGQYIDAAMIEENANFLGEMVMGYTINKVIPERTGNRDAIMAPHGCYPCQNTPDEAEWVAIAVADQKEWKALCRLMGNPAWSKSEEFSDELSRWKNQASLDQYLGQWTTTLGAYEAAERLQKAGIAASVSYSTRQLTHDPHLAQRGFFLKTRHAVLGEVTLTSLPYRFSNSPAGNFQTAPLLGEHNDYVFGQLLGMSKEEIRQLTEEKVFY